MTTPNPPSSTTLPPKKPSKSGSQKRQRKHIAQLSCTEKEYEQIKNQADKSGLTISGYLRTLVFGKKIEQPRAAKKPPIALEEIIKLRQELRKIGGSLNQLNQAQQHNNAFDSDTFNQLCEQHINVLNAIMKTLGRE